MSTEYLWHAVLIGTRFTDIQGRKARTKYHIVKVGHMASGQKQL